jgi:hypothetical protein
MHLARDLVDRRQPLGQQRLDLPLVEPVQPVHRLLDAKFLLRGRHRVAEPVGEGGEVPFQGHGSVVGSRRNRARICFSPAALSGVGAALAAGAEYRRLKPPLPLSACQLSVVRGAELLRLTTDNGPLEH